MCDLPDASTLFLDEEKRKERKQISIHRYLQPGLASNFASSDGAHGITISSNKLLLNN